MDDPFPSTLANAMFYSNRADVLAVGDGEITLVRVGQRVWRGDVLANVGNAGRQ
jgi:hypothetical protein